jgi:hypothetical protein
MILEAWYAWYARGIREYGPSCRPQACALPTLLHALLRGELSFLVVGPKRRDRYILI